MLNFQRARKQIVLAVKDKMVATLLGVRLPVSPVPHLLLSNMPPSDLEVVLVEVAINEARREYQRILSERAAKPISEKRSLLIGEDYQLHRIGEFIDRHQSILSAIRRIPQELLQEIFIYAADAHLNPHRLHSEPRWTIPQVCQIWRTTALSLASLWNRLEVSLPAISQTRTIGQLKILKEYLRRSRDAPLDILTLDWTSSTYDRSEDPVLKLFLNHCERWRRLSMSPVSVDTLAAFRTLKGRLPLLQDLALHIAPTSDHYMQLVAPKLDVFEVAPCLRTVSITGMAYAKVPILPFSQLVRYETSAPTISFTKITQLHALTVTAAFPLYDLFQSSPLDSTSPIMHFDSLTELIIRATFSEYSRTLRSVRLPLIEEIRIESRTQALCPDLMFILSCNLEPCLLTTLELKVPYISAEYLPALLRFTPALTELQVGIFFLSDIVALTPTVSDEVLVPRLEKCLLLVCSDDLNDEMCDAIALLASLRCEMPDGVGNGGFRRLKLLQIHNSSNCYVLQAEDRMTVSIRLRQTDFEIWRNTLSTTEFDDLEAFKFAILQEVPPYYRQTQAYNALRVEKILTEMEQYEIKDPRTLIKSDLYCCVQDCCLVSFHMDQATQNSWNPIAEHARRIIQKWSILLEPLIQSLHWAATGDGDFDLNILYLTYIANDHSIRSCAKDASDLLICREKLGMLSSLSF